jgi:hypothetical protein
VAGRNDRRIMTENVSYRLLYLDTKPAFGALIGRRGADGPFVIVAVRTREVEFVHLIPAPILDRQVAARPRGRTAFDALEKVWDDTEPATRREIQSIEDRLKETYSPEEVDIRIGEGAWQTMIWRGVDLKEMAMVIESLGTRSNIGLEEVERFGHSKVLFEDLLKEETESDREVLIDAMIRLLRFDEFSCGPTIARLLLDVLPGKAWRSNKKFAHVHDRLAQHVYCALPRLRDEEMLKAKFFPRFTSEQAVALRRHFDEIRGPGPYVEPARPPPRPIVKPPPPPPGRGLRQGWAVAFRFEDFVRTCLRAPVARTPLDPPYDDPTMTCRLDAVSYDFVCGREGREFSAYDLGPLSIVVRAGPGGTGRAQIRLFRCRAVLVKPDGRVLPVGTVTAPGPIVPCPEEEEETSTVSIALELRKSRFTSDLPLKVVGTFQPLRRANESQVFAIAGLGEGRSGACLLLRGSPPDKYILRAIVLFEYSLGIVRR